MIKGRMTLRDGTPALLLGLTRENMARLLEDQPIRVTVDQQAELGIVGPEVVLVGGESEGAISQQLGGLNLTPEVAGQKLTLKGELNTDRPAQLSPPVQLTLSEVDALTASLVGSCDLVEQQSSRNTEAWVMLNSLRTLFAELGHGMGRVGQ